MLCPASSGAGVPSSKSPRNITHNPTVVSNYDPLPSAWQHHVDTNGIFNYPLGRRTAFSKSSSTTIPVVEHHYPGRRAQSRRPD